MRLAIAFIPMFLLAASCGVSKGDLGKGGLFDNDRSLWSTTDVPQVGTIMRLTFADRDGKKLLSATQLLSELALQYKPEPPVAVGDLEQTYTAKNGLKFAIGFLAKGAPNANTDLSNAKTVKLKSSNVQVSQPADFLSFQNFIRSFDGNHRGSGNISSTYAQINEAGNKQRLTKVMTPYWVITKVFTGESVEYSYSSTGGLKANAGCGSEANKCVVPTSTITASLDLSRDRQEIFKGKNRPVWVVIKPIGVNSSGSLYIEDTVRGPDVIS